MAKSKERAKFGYLNYADIHTRIEEGKLDQYDVVYCKDRKNQYLIDAELNLIEIQSRVNVYESELIAVASINQDTSTYVGQLLSVKIGDSYKGYVVNKNTENKFYITPLWESPDAIDYNSLSNIPITNLNGTLQSPIILNNLSNGIYMIKGVYETPENEQVTTLIGHYVSIDSIGNTKSITRVQSDKIYKSTITNSEIKSEEYITDEYLESKNYVPLNSLDAQVSALGFIKKTETKEYVETIVEEIVDDVVDKAIDEKLDNIKDDEINILFVEEVVEDNTEE